MSKCSNLQVVMLTSKQQNSAMSKIDEYMTQHSRHAADHLRGPLH